MAFQNTRYTYTHIYMFTQIKGLVIMPKKVSRLRCRVLLFSKYYACAIVFVDDISPTMHSMRAGAVAQHQQQQRQYERAFRSLAKTCFYGFPKH